MKEVTFKRRILILKGVTKTFVTDGFWTYHLRIYGNLSAQKLLKFNMLKHIEFMFRTKSMLRNNITLTLLST